MIKREVEVKFITNDGLESVSVISLVNGESVDINLTELGASSLTSDITRAVADLFKISDKESDRIYDHVYRFACQVLSMTDIKASLSTFIDIYSEDEGVLLDNIDVIINVTKDICDKRIFYREFKNKASIHEIYKKNIDILIGIWDKLFVDKSISKLMLGIALSDFINGYVYDENDDDVIDNRILTACSSFIECAKDGYDDARVLKILLAGVYLGYYHM